MVTGVFFRAARKICSLVSPLTDAEGLPENLSVNNDASFKNRMNLTETYKIYQIKTKHSGKKAENQTYPLKREAVFVISMASILFFVITIVFPSLVGSPLVVSAFLNLI
jgi:hypothetical protein